MCTYRWFDFARAVLPGNRIPAAPQKPFKHAKSRLCGAAAWEIADRQKRDQPDLRNPTGDSEACAAALPAFIECCLRGNTLPGLCVWPAPTKAIQGKTAE